MDIVSQFYEMSLANVYKHLCDVLLFHVFIVLRDILNTEIALESSLEVNVTIKVNIQKRRFRGSCE